LTAAEDTGVRALNGDWLLPLAIVAALTGCNEAPAPVAGTGAAEAAQDYYEALLRKDWPRAYALLDQASRNRIPAQPLGLALRQLRPLDFEPTAVYVRACEENADGAIAHVVLTGQAAGRQRFYRDTLVLRRDSGGWRVVLSAKFGQMPRRP
jgi:hypothetical protein